LNALRKYDFVVAGSRSQLLFVYDLIAMRLHLTTILLVIFIQACPLPTSYMYIEAQAKNGTVLNISDPTKGGCKRLG
jgi:hypothetical protein